MASSDGLSPLRARASALTARAHVPFSNEPAAAAILLDDGAWIPGVRVESASYSLTLPALLNAYTTAVSAGRADDMVALALSRSMRPEEEVYVDALPNGRYEPAAADAWVRGGNGRDEELPDLADPLPPFLEGTVDGARQGVARAREITARAYVPSSDYPVGAVLELSDGRLVPGVNVEHSDWARILCAERNALGTVQSYALPAPDHLYLTCDEDPEGTPCGACRQLLAELAPDVMIWMDRHDAPPQRSSVSTLLPGSFRGQVLLDES